MIIVPCINRNKIIGNIEYRNNSLKFYLNDMFSQQYKNFSVALTEQDVYNIAFVLQDTENAC